MLPHLHAPTCARLNPGYFQMATLLKFILSVGTDRELLGLREAVLRNAGLEVCSINNAKEACTTIENTRCGVLLLCYSFPVAVRRALAIRFRERCRKSRIVVNTNEP